MTYQTIAVDPLTPVIGAEIAGVDIAEPMGNQQFQEVHDALMAHCVLFFRDQDITLDQQKAFARRFGELHIHPAAPTPEGHPEVIYIHADENSKHTAGERWHSDVTCDVEPPMGSVLHLHTMPPTGGDTMFTNMYAAYEDLSDTMQRFLSGLVAVHESEHIYRGRYKDRGVDDTGKVFPSAEHPVVRTHPVTGRQALFVNPNFTMRIKGMKEKESRNLLDFLFEHMLVPPFQCRFRWRPGSVAFWDNRCTMHHALWDYFPQVRSGFRVTIKGDRPFYRA